ncbi:flagellar biosynthetic protein FliO [Nevskia sp.]|uniref:flagellar biosynthetic protein FliO n=1 Tax=Nevskia sp. TaxID=1929292 RepID=UPI003F722F14
MNTPAAASTASTLPGFGQMALSLLVVLGLIFVLAWGLRRLQGLRAGGSASLRIHGGLQVGAKEKVLLIEAGGQHLLIGVSAGGVSTLHVYAEPPAMPASGDGAPELPPFAVAFREALKKSLGQKS